MQSQENALKVAESLLRIKAVELKPEQPFTWASGLKSPIYCDNRKTLSFPMIRTFIRQQFVSAIEENFSKPEIRSVIDKWIDEMIIGLINIIYIFNPPLIVLGGGIMNEDYVIDLIDRKIYNLLMDNFKNVNIVRSKLKSDSALLGVSYEASQL